MAWWKMNETILFEFWNILYTPKWKDCIYICFFSAFATSWYDDTQIICIVLYFMFVYLVVFCQPIEKNIYTKMKEKSKIAPIFIRHMLSKLFGLTAIFDLGKLMGKK